MLTGIELKESKTSFTIQKIITTLQHRYRDATINQYGLLGPFAATMYHNPVQWLLVFYYRSSFIIRRADSCADSRADSRADSCGM
jgi:hypothetical protein